MIDVDVAALDELQLPDPHRAARQRRSPCRAGRARWARWASLGALGAFGGSDRRPPPLLFAADGCADNAASPAPRQGSRSWRASGASRAAQITALPAASHHTESHRSEKHGHCLQVAARDGLAARRRAATVDANRGRYGATMALTNWAQSHTYQARTVHTPSTLEQLQEIVARARRIQVLGTRHTFSDIGDSDELVSLERLDDAMVVDRSRPVDGRRGRRDPLRRARRGAASRRAGAGKSRITAAHLGRGGGGDRHPWLGRPQREPRDGRRGIGARHLRR